MYFESLLRTSNKELLPFDHQVSDPCALSGSQVKLPNELRAGRYLWPQVDLATSLVMFKKLFQNTSLVI